MALSEPIGIFNQMSKKTAVYSAVAATEIAMMEALEARQLLTTVHGGVPDAVIALNFSGTSIGFSTEFGLGNHSGGHGVDSDMRYNAAMVDRMIKSWQPNGSKTYVVNWGTISKSWESQGQTVGVAVLAYMRQHSNLHFVVIAEGHSQGNYPANAALRYLYSNAPNLDKEVFIELAPTGVPFLGQGVLTPLVVPGRAINFDVSDDRPVYGPLAINNFNEPGTVIHVVPTDPISNKPYDDSVRAHNQIPEFVARNGGSSILANIIVISLEMDTYKSNVARAAASDTSAKYSNDVQNDFYVSGGGPPLLVDFIRDMFAHGVKHFLDDANYALEFGADKAGDLIATGLADTGKFVTKAFDSAGSVIKSIEDKGEDIVEAAADGLGEIGSLLHHLNPFRW